MNRRQAYIHALSSLLVAALAPGALGQAAVELKAQSRDVYAGEAFVLYLEISGFEQAEEPVVPEVADCSLVKLPATSESS